jgi:hypothetical protein
MLNKRKIRNIDPKRLSEYNKFLSTLDRNSHSANETKNNIYKMDDLKRKTDEEIKNDIDKLIEGIENKILLKNF